MNLLPSPEATIGFKIGVVEVLGSTTYPSGSPTPTMLLRAALTTMASSALTSTRHWIMFLNGLTTKNGLKKRWSPRLLTNRRLPSLWLTSSSPNHQQVKKISLQPPLRLLPNNLILVFPISLWNNLLLHQYLRLFQ